MYPNGDIMYIFEEDGLKYGMIGNLEEDSHGPLKRHSIIITVQTQNELRKVIIHVGHVGHYNYIRCSHGL
jgi:hypothetical protein